MVARQDAHRRARQTRFGAGDGPGTGLPRSRNIVLAVVVSLVGLALVTGAGHPMFSHLFTFLEFYAGVFTLVSLTLTVIVGLVATDRMLLPPRHRVWVQSIHRTLGIMAVSCLAVHVTTEVLGQRISVAGLLLPFLFARFEVGVGIVAAYLMVTVMWTGMVRARFASRERARLWRPLHAVAYLCWPVALWHGLNAGRPAAVWVTASYLVLGLLTMAALGLRISAERQHRRRNRALDRTTVVIAPTARDEVRFSSADRWGAPAAAWEDRDVRAEEERFIRDRQLEREARERVFEREARERAFEREARERAFEREQRDRAEQELERERAELDRRAAELDRERAERESRLDAEDFPRYTARASVLTPQEYEPDDTPTLVNLDAQRQMRRGPGSKKADGQKAKADGQKAAELTDADYWRVLRGELG